MSYNQDNPFSRKSSPLNSFDSLVTKLEGQGKSHEAATKIAGSVANAKMHGAGSGPTAAQKARHGVSRKPSTKPSTKPVEENRMTKGDQMPSRKSSSPLNNTGVTGLNYSKELQYMPIEDDMHRGMSRESSSPLHGDGNKSAHVGTPPHYRDGLKPEEWAAHRVNNPDHKHSVSRKSSSPVKHVRVTRSAAGNIIPDKHKHQAKDPKRYLGKEDYDGKVSPYNPKKDLEERGHERWNDRLDERSGEPVIRDKDEFLEEIRQERSGGPSRRSSSPLNNTGMTGLNYSKELQYMPNQRKKKKRLDTGRPAPKKGVSRKVSAKRAKKMVEKGKGVMSYGIGGGYQGRGKPRLEGHNPGEEHNKGTFTKIKRKHRTGKERTSYSSDELGKSMDVR